MSNNIYDILKKIQNLESPKQALTESKTMNTVKELHNESKKEKSTRKGSIAEAVKTVEQQLNKKYKGFKNTVGEGVKHIGTISPTDQGGEEYKPEPGYRVKAEFEPGTGKQKMGFVKAEPETKTPQAAMPSDAKDKPVDESGLQAYLGKKKYGETGMKALQKAGREGASKEKMAMIRAKHDKMDEGSYNEDMLSAKEKSFAALAEPKDKITYADKIAGAKKGVKKEGNKFSGNLMKARAQGKDQADLDGDGDMEKVSKGASTRREGWDERQKYLDKKKGPESKGGAGKKAGTRYGGSAQKDDDEETDGEGKPVEKKKGRPKGTGGGAKFSFKKPKD
jgi:hypothetical protein